MKARDAMTVGQLIEALKEFPKSAIVLELCDDADHEAVMLKEMRAVNGRPCLVFDNSIVTP